MSTKIQLISSFEFARFSEAIWDEASQGFEAYKSYWQSHSYFGPGTIYVEEPKTAAQIFNGNLTYNIAGWVGHMLRGVMGDSLFFESLRSYGYNDSLAYSDATTEDFKNQINYISVKEIADHFPPLHILNLNFVCNKVLKR